MGRGERKEGRVGERKEGEEGVHDDEGEEDAGNDQDGVQRRHERGLDALPLLVRDVLRPSLASAQASPIPTSPQPPPLRLHLTRPREDDPFVCSGCGDAGDTPTTAQRQQHRQTQDAHHGG